MTGRVAARRSDPLPLFASPHVVRPSRVDTGQGFVNALRSFSFNGASTVELTDGDITYFVNEFWTAGQRQAHSIHEISYRACFKAQLPEFFIARLTDVGDHVYDPFSGRGTTAIQAALMERKPIANDVNPLSAMLIKPRLAPPSYAAIQTRLASLDLTQGQNGDDEVGLLEFYHIETLRQVCALRDYLHERDASGRIDSVDEWIRMVAINRLTGHSPGFFSVYTLPPNQAVSVESQRKINIARNQKPPQRDVSSIILKKTRSLLADGQPGSHPNALLMTGLAEDTPELPDADIDLLVTSPPFLDVVDYEGDNWLRCWFAGIDVGAVKIDRHKDVRAWEMFIRRAFEEFARVMRPGGTVAFEVGEVRGGRVLLEKHVSSAIDGLPFNLLGVMVNQQEFTKTANCWGISNNKGGTNTNRIVLAQRSE